MRRVDDCDRTGMFDQFVIDLPREFFDSLVSQPEIFLTSAKNGDK